MEGVEGVVGHDDVVEQRQVETIAGFAQLRGVHYVGSAGFWISGRMVVHYRHGKGTPVDSALHYPAHIESR